MLENTILYIFLAVFLVSLTAFSGVLFLSFKDKTLKKILPLLIALSTGSLLGGVFIHLLPKLNEMNNGNFEKLSMLILVGIILFYIIEKFLHWHHHHIPEESQDCNSCEEIEKIQKIKPVGYMILFSDGFHNFLDGVMIASTFMIDVRVGVITTIIVLLHEIPQEIGDFGVLLHAGFSKTKALLFNFLSGITAVLGAGITILFTKYVGDFNLELTAIAGGGFLYIAMVDLIPELHTHKHSKKTLILEFLFVLIGILLMFGVHFIKHLFE